jgi:ASC-1-like (ASCH) protein
MKKGWTKYNNRWLREHSKHFWQKELEPGIYANVHHYEPFQTMLESWELEIQIPEYRSITGMTINVSTFNYDKENFTKWENDANKLIKALII